MSSELSNDPGSRKKLVTRDQQIPLQGVQLSGIVLRGGWQYSARLIDVAQCQASQDPALDGLLAIERKIDARGSVHHGQDLGKGRFVGIA